MRDSTGLIKFGMRYYDPNLGRWTQRDPLSTLANGEYLYVAGNPINRTDRGGLCYTDFNFTFTFFVGATLGAQQSCTGQWYFYVGPAISVRLQAPPAT